MSGIDENSLIAAAQLWVIDKGVNRNPIPSLTIKDCMQYVGVTEKELTNEAQQQVSVLAGKLDYEMILDIAEHSMYNDHHFNNKNPDGNVVNKKVLGAAVLTCITQSRSTNTPIRKSLGSVSMCMLFIGLPLSIVQNPSNRAQVIELSNKISLSFLNFYSKWPPKESISRKLPSSVAAKRAIVGGVKFSPIIQVPSVCSNQHGQTKGGPLLETTSKKISSVNSKVVSAYPRSKIMSSKQPAKRSNSVKLPTSQSIRIMQAEKKASGRFRDLRQHGIPAWKVSDQIAKELGVRIDPSRIHKLARGAYAGKTPVKAGRKSKIVFQV